MRGAALGSPQENLRPAPRQQPFPSTHCVFAFKGKQRAVPHACEEPGAALALGAASGGTCQCLPWQGSKAQGWRCSLALAHCAECLNKSLTPTRNGRFGEGFCTAFAAGWKLRAGRGADMCVQSSPGGKGSPGLMASPRQCFARMKLCTGEALGVEVSLFLF